MFNLSVLLHKCCAIIQVLRFKSSNFTSQPQISFARWAAGPLADDSETDESILGLSAAPAANDLDLPAPLHGRIHAVTISISRQMLSPRFLFFACGHDRAVAAPPQLWSADEDTDPTQSAQADA